MKQQFQNLTEQESAFAAEHHGLIYRYLSNKRLDEDEYYDVVVFGYLNGVRKYFRREELRKQYSFTTLAWGGMDSCLSNYQKSKCCPKNQATLLCIHEPYCNAYPLEEMIADSRDYAQELLESISVKETMLCFEQTERDIVQLLMDGYPKAEIRRILSLTAEELSKTISDIQLKTRNSLLMQAA